MIPLLQEYLSKYPSLPLYLRGDSGFAAPELYEACEENDCKYAIRLKQNKTLVSLASDKAKELQEATKFNTTVSDPSAAFWKNGTAPASWRIVLLLFLPFPVQAFLMVLNNTSDSCFASLDINSPHTDLSIVCCVFLSLPSQLQTYPAIGMERY